jgi:hypothetical protein
MPADDEACGVVSCGGLARECATFADLEANRCAAPGFCYASDDPSVCTQLMPLPDGTPCSIGSCLSGECVPLGPDAGAGPSLGAEEGGCAAAGPRTSRVAGAWPALPLLLLALRARARRRKGCALP